MIQQEDGPRRKQLENDFVVINKVVLPEQTLIEQPVKRIEVEKEIEIVIEKEAVRLPAKRQPLFAPERNSLERPIESTSLLMVIEI